MNREEAKQRLLTEIQASKDHYKIIIEVMNAVKREHKKSGGDYENITKNFTLDEATAKKHNAIIRWEKSVWDDRRFDALKLEFTDIDGDNSLHYTRNTLYFHVYECLDEGDAKHAEMEKNGRLVEGGVGLKDFYELTPDEIVEVIKQERERAEARLNTLAEREGEIVEKGLEAFDHIQALEQIKNETTTTDGHWDSVAFTPMRRALAGAFERLRY